MEETQSDGGGGENRGGEEEMKKDGRERGNEEG